MSETDQDTEAFGGTADEASDSEGPYAAGPRGPQGPQDGQRGEDIDPEAVDVDISPVREIEQDLAQKQYGSEDERREFNQEIQLTGGFLEILEYAEDLVEKSFDWDDFGASPEARRDLAIVLGRIARERNVEWVSEYGRELYAFGLFMSCYGGPIGWRVAQRVFQAYKEAHADAT